MNIEQNIIGDWYIVRKIAPDVFWIKEPGLVSFYLFKNQSNGLFIDTGLGLSKSAFIFLTQHFGIKKYEVICTHAHSDHTGLNSFASECKLSRTEWEKYRAQNEDQQLGYVLEQLVADNSTPSILNKSGNSIVGNLEWKPSGYLQNGNVYHFHNWSFDVYETPGHTSGSLTFHEKSLNFIFVGDLIYDGTMYLHLKDSNIEDFSHSLNTLISIIENNPGIKVWPAHNSIPLDANFITNTKSVLSLISMGLLKSNQIIPKDKIFEEGRLFKHGSIKLITRSIC